MQGKIPPHQKGCGDFVLTLVKRVKICDLWRLHCVVADGSDVKVGLSRLRCYRLSRCCYTVPCVWTLCCVSVTRWLHDASYQVRSWLLLAFTRPPLGIGCYMMPPNPAEAVLWRESYSPELLDMRRPHPALTLPTSIYCRHFRANL